MRREIAAFAAIGVLGGCGGNSIPTPGSGRPGSEHIIMFSGFTPIGAELGSRGAALRVARDTCSLPRMPNAAEVKLSEDELSQTWPIGYNKYFGFTCPASGKDSK